MRRHFWYMVHHCVAHPLVGLFPMNWAFRFHDWTASKKDARPIYPPGANYDTEGE